MLLDGGFGKAGQQALDVAGDMRWLHVRQIVHAALSTEFRKLASGVVIGAPRMPFEDICGEEVEEALGRPRLLAGTGQGERQLRLHVLRNGEFYECGALGHCDIRTISESSKSIPDAKLTCWVVGSVSLVRICVCKCPSATFLAPLSRCSIASRNDFEPA